MLVRLVQPEKTPGGAKTNRQHRVVPMLVRLLGIVMLVRLVQPENAKPSMLVTLLGS